MQRIWNALLYGDFETRKSIGSVIFFSVLGIGFIIAAGIQGKFAMFIIGMLFGVVALIISQTFTLVDDDFVAEVGKDGKKESIRSVSVMKNGVSSSKSSNASKSGVKKEEKKDTKDQSVKKEPEQKEAVKKEAVKKEPIKKEPDKKEEQEKPEKKETVKKEKIKKEKVKKEKVKKEKTKKTKDKKKKETDNNKNDDLNEIDENEIFANRKGLPVISVNEKELKKLLRKYRVKKDHRPIIIDNSVKYSIKECPAFIWRAHNDIYLLLLEKEPRKIKLDRGSVKHVDYAPNVRGNRQTEYQAFKKSNLIVSSFEGYIPDYFDSPNSRNAMKVKHLYEIAPDIQISNRSIATVMDLLVLNFMPDDKYTQSDKFNRFFKRIYAANLMYKDRAYSITDYKESVEKTLMEMCYEDLPYQEFQLTLENLVRARFISQEYADHYTDVRSRIARK